MSREAAPTPDLAATSGRLIGLGVSAPTALLDTRRARANITRMATRARAAGVGFRPHFKTHQSATIGAWFADAGVTAITVSSLAMAEYFADAGWRDITVALLANPGAAARIERLAGRLQAARSAAGETGPGLGLLIDDAETLARWATMLSVPVRIWVKVDTGYGRTGIRWDASERLHALGHALAAAEAATNTMPTGLLTHAGHAYQAAGRTELTALFAETAARLRTARTALAWAHARSASLALSVGDTPTCSVADLTGVDEIRPGNFVFYDLMQLALGTCAAADLAVAVACPVLGWYPDRRELVVHGGAVHLAKEQLIAADGRPWYGCLGTLGKDGFGPLLPTARVGALTQEHGVITVPDGTLHRQVAALAPGDVVLVFPIHACLTCDLYDRYLTTDGTVIPRR